jgi:hypothetical protein
MTRSLIHRALAFLSILGTVGCSLTSSPADAALVTHISSPVSLAVTGQHVMVDVIARNSGRTTHHTIGCGPGLDVEVRAPDGGARLILSPLPHICPLMDSNALEPGETDTVSVRWDVPFVVGEYELRGGVRAERGLIARSAPTRITVVPGR